MIRDSGAAAWLLVAVMLLYIGVLAHNDKGVLTWEPQEPANPISGLLGTPTG